MIIMIIMIIIFIISVIIIIIPSNNADTWLLAVLLGHRHLGKEAVLHHVRVTIHSILIILSILCILIIFILLSIIISPALYTMFLLAPTGALVLMMVYYISKATHFFRFGAFMPFYIVTSVTLSRLNSINAIAVTRC